MTLILEVPFIAWRKAIVGWKVSHDSEENRERNILPPDLWNPHGWSDDKQTLFVCASTEERREEIVDYVSFALDLDDVRDKVRVILCENHEEFESSLTRVLSQRVCNNVGVCLRLDDMDVNAYFLALSSVAVKLLDRWEDVNIRDVRNLLHSIVTFGTEEDVPDAVDQTTLFDDHFLDFSNAHLESACYLMNIFQFTPLIDLFNHQHYPRIKSTVGVRIRGDI